ncbi:DNA repair protein RAD51 homolog 4 isoform X2 [Macadamia integrifolia]|uniref:DNA repair protein RAD51 homolog 4 isoform X2 n=1 Tax=Macadamia integrifolia TaxID=60698 RepID=UPI001C4F2231|nr:DNA repair protein RAD51 homolog 4 isoform X2 [Macadamia integrifolia]
MLPSSKALELEFSEIDSNFLQFCASHGILSVEDFLVHDLNVLVAFAEQHGTSKKLKQGITRILSIIDNHHQPWLNGMKLLEDALQNKHVLSTGCEGVDHILQGGLREGQLTELVGPSSCGKTQICLQAASNVADKYMGAVIFLDTCNSFSPRRIACFLTKRMSSSSNEEKQRILERVMSNIFSYSVFDIFSLLDVLQQLESKLRSQEFTGDNQVQLLIIDSISSLITPILGGNGANGRSLMTSAGLLLKKLAHELNLSVLVTNHMVGGDGGALKPALGESWKSVPHVRILLSRDHGGNFCDASLLKHPSVVK